MPPYLYFIYLFIRVCRERRISHAPTRLEIYSSIDCLSVFVWKKLSINYNKENNCPLVQEEEREENVCFFL